MVLPKPLLAAAAALAAIPPTQAWLYNITVPDSAPASSTIEVTVYNKGYIQTNYDFGIIWGQSDSENDRQCSTCVGHVLGWTNLYGNPAYKIPQNGGFVVNVTLERYMGPAIVVAAVPYQVGVTGGNGIRYLKAPIVAT